MTTPHDPDPSRDNPGDPAAAVPGPGSVPGAESPGAASPESPGPESPGPESSSPESPGSGHSNSRIARSSALLASGTLVSRILGFVRVALLAGALGLLDSLAGNAWQTANTLPNTIYIILAGGIINNIFVPSLTRAMARDDGGRDFSDRLITLALASLFGITVVVTLSASVLTQFYALSWSGEQLALAVAFAYLCLPQIFFYGLYTVLGQVLNSMEKFGWFTWAPVANNIVAIGGLLIFMQLYPDAGDIGVGEWTGPMVWWLAGTATLGVAVQAFVLIFPLYRAGFRWRPRFGFRGVGLGDASRLAKWTLAIIAVSQFGMWLSTNLLNRAVDLDPSVAGKITYETAFLIFILPHSIVTYSLVTAMFTQLSRTAARDDYEGLRAQWSQGTRLLGVAMIPISIGMVVLAPAITTVMFWGNDIEETLATAYVAMPLLIGLAPYAFYILATRVFFAFQDGKTPFLLQVVISAISLVGLGAVYLAPPAVTAIGISTAQTLGQVGAAIAAIWLVRKALRGFSYTRVARTWVRALLAALVATVPTIGVGALSLWLIEGRGAYVVTLFLGGPLFFLVYGIVAHAIGISELREAAAPLLRRLGLASRLGLTSQNASPAVPRPQEQATEPTSTTSQADEPTAPVTSPGAMGADTPNDGEVRTSVRKESALHGIDAGTTLGKRYVLEDLLAQRDDGLDYWSARDSTLDRLVAVTIVPATGAYEEMAHNVQDGARRTAGIDDPRLVRVLDMGIDDGICWIVEEGLAEALSLAALVEDGPLPAEEARRIIGEAAAGLEAARRRGLHHLFLSPHAVLRTGEGNIKLSGVAVAAAIEQVDDIGSAQASIIDTSDLVSLLYTALTGYWPGEEMEGLTPARRLANGALPAPSELVGGVPGDLDALCRQVLAEDYDPRTGPRTPGQLTQQLAPWSPEIVHGPGGTPRQGEQGEQAPGGSAGSGGAGGSGADQEDQTDITDAQPTYFRTADAGAAGVVGAGAAGAMSSADAFGAPADADAGAAGRPDFSNEPFSVGDVDDGSGAFDDGAGAYPAAGSDARYAGSAETSRSGIGSTIVVLALILAVVGGAIFFGSRLIGGDEDPGEAATPPPATATPTDEETETAAPEPEPEPEPTGWTIGDSIEITDVRPFDSNQYADREDLVQNAFDGDPNTSWNSHTYTAPNWGNLKTGVGLAVDLGESQPIGEVTITFPQGDYGAEVFIGDVEVADDTDLEGLTSLGQSDSASGEWTLTADEGEDPPEGRYVIIWFDRAWTGPSGEIVYVSDIEVASADES